MTNPIRLDVIDERIDLKVVDDAYQFPPLDTTNPIRLDVINDQPIELSIIQDGAMQVGVGVELIKIVTPEYQGQYIVIPEAHEEQKLETKGYKMMDDVTVKKVPYFETRNSHGTTIYIASEVD